MNAKNCCRGCGNVLPHGSLNGLCPVCLLQEGLAGDGSAVDTGPFMSGTHAASGALATLDESIGGLPRVLLRDSELGDGPGPVVQPASPEMPAAGDRPGRLQLLGEIARGGMGAILKGRDPDLGHDLAVKVLLESHKDKPELIRRFIEEAQIGGQLQHPGIVPIYELGAFADRRPYFAMKLVKGRTLATLLGERPFAAPSPVGAGSVRRSDTVTGESDRVSGQPDRVSAQPDRGTEPPPTGRRDPPYDLPRFLAISEQVAQTVAYAHARGVIHRDLKPSNIMVGSFGEVQVMDWGLAKVLPQGGAADDASAGKMREHGTVIATARSGGDSDSDLSKAGSVMGTPSYMAPEQARGEVDRLDERCDVFALGSVLCEILTGEPAFIGRSSGEIQRKASRGELKDALDRLEASGSDAELIALAKECLAPELEDRPRHAGEVAGRINAYRLHNGLGCSLLEFGEVDSAFSEVREALQAKPNNPSYLDSLGWARLARGELKPALATLREAIRLQKEQPGSEIQSHLRFAERLAALEGRLDAIVRGQSVPAEAERRLDVADLCRVTKRFAAAAHFYREAFRSRPALADDLKAQHRLHAAISAAQAGTNRNPAKDDTVVDDAERARWRVQSLEWLRAEENACGGILAPNAPRGAGPIRPATGFPPKLALARKTLDIMTHHRDLACVRDEKDLARLPERERKEWQSLWAEVAALLKEAG